MCNQSVEAKFANAVHKELLELHKLGVPVSGMALEECGDPDFYQEYGNMRVKDAASLLMELWPASQERTYTFK